MVYCDLLYRILLLSVILGLDYLGLALCSGRRWGRTRRCRRWGRRCVVVLENILVDALCP